MKTTRESTFAATLRTTMLMALLSGFLVAIGFLIGGPDMAILFLLGAAAINFFTYFFSDKLALMVVDQDMGDEVRSVHSLSGGETFLVSLALALGLASLSSHRVQVESLFIDEGFGSLDAETLDIAMNALDNLNAQGRKVGVISHVREMTDRIGTRIQVRRLAAGHSRIVIP